ncbi:MAG: cyclic nucleotide-binding/CBS domain-containing protein [Candidatus Woesearchaeota archaeon]
MRTLAVGEMMTTNPITCHPNDNIVSVSKLLKKYNISSVIVVEDKVVQGLITVDDIVRRVIAEKLDPEKTIAKDIMSKNLISVEPQNTLEETIEVLNSNRISQVPVMKDKQLFGFVTIKDILRLEPAFFEFFFKTLEEEEKVRQKFIREYDDADLDL